LTGYLLQRESLQLKNQENSLRYLPAEVLGRAQSELDRTKKVVDLLIDQRLNSEKSQIEKVATHLAALHHHSVLNRGYTLTTLEGRIVRSSAQIKKGNSIKTRFKDGVITSKVEAQHD
jgi:exodeoxyribonuclease VII large subunit